MKGFFDKLLQKQEKQTPPVKQEEPIKRELNPIADWVILIDGKAHKESATSAITAAIQVCNRLGIVFRDTKFKVISEAQYNKEEEKKKLKVVA